MQFVKGSRRGTSWVVNNLCLRHSGSKHSVLLPRVSLKSGNKAVKGVLLKGGVQLQAYTKITLTLKLIDTTSVLLKSNF